jgi:hypothetical protein
MLSFASNVGQQCRLGVARCGERLRQALTVYLSLSVQALERGKKNIETTQIRG